MVFLFMRYVLLLLWSSTMDSCSLLSWWLHTYVRSKFCCWITKHSVLVVVFCRPHVIVVSLGTSHLLERFQNHWCVRFRDMHISRLSSQLPELGHGNCPQNGLVDFSNFCNKLDVDKLRNVAEPDFSRKNSKRPKNVFD